MKKYYISLIIKVLIIALVIGIDILTKIYFQSYFENGGKDITLINGILGLTYVKNTGGAFGIFSDNLTMLIIFTVLFIIVFGFMDFHMKSKNGWYIVGFSLILGGALGNFIDRIALNYVRDFIQFQFMEFPIFNFADIFLTVGVICYFVYLIFYEFKKTKQIKEVIKDE